jgi:hypothetical protein
MQQEDEQQNAKGATLNLQSQQSKLKEVQKLLQEEDLFVPEWVELRGQ